MKECPECGSSNVSVKRLDRYHEVYDYDGDFVESVHIGYEYLCKCSQCGHFSSKRSTQDEAVRVWDSQKHASSIAKKARSMSREELERYFIDREAETKSGA